MCWLAPYRHGKGVPGEEGAVEPPQESKIEGEAMRALNYLWFEMKGHCVGKRSWIENKKCLNAFPASEGKAGGEFPCARTACAITGHSHRVQHPPHPS